MWFSDQCGDWVRQEDILDGDPLFETDATTLSKNSPAIDRGVLPEDLTEVDVNGNARIQGSCIDIGAHESTFDAGIASCLTVGVSEEIVSSSVVEIFPNPMADLAQIRLENDWREALSLQVIDVLGQVVKRTTLRKSGTSETWEFDANQLQNGTYQLLLSNGRQLVVKPFVIVR